MLPDIPDDDKTTAAQRTIVYFTPQSPERLYHRAHCPAILRSRNVATSTVEQALDCNRYPCLRCRPDDPDHILPPYPAARHSIPIGEARR